MHWLPHRGPQSCLRRPRPPPPPSRHSAPPAALRRRRMCLNAGIPRAAGGRAGDWGPQSEMRSRTLGRIPLWYDRAPPTADPTPSRTARSPDAPGPRAGSLAHFRAVRRPVEALARPQGRGSHPDPVITARHDLRGPSCRPRPPGRGATDRRVAPTGRKKTGVRGDPARGGGSCGRLGVLKWARANGCPWDKPWCETVALGQLEVLAWIDENGGED